jgi:hypothetical protein
MRYFKWNANSKTESAIRNPVTSSDDSNVAHVEADLNERRLRSKIVYNVCVRKCSRHANIPNRQKSQLILLRVVPRVANADGRVVTISRAEGFEP